MQERDFIAGLRAAVPTALGYISIGLAFGIVAAGAGLSTLEVFLMSFWVYGGTAQFAMVALMAAKADLSTIGLTVFLLNLRNMFLSLHAATILTLSGFWSNLGLGTLMTDETYGVLIGEHLHHKDIKASWMHGNNLLSYLAWVLSTTLGTAIGSGLPNPRGFGLDFALVAMFVGILSVQLSTMVGNGVKKIVLILASVGLSYLGLTLLISEALGILGATLVGCIVGVYLDGRD